MADTIKTVPRFVQGNSTILAIKPMWEDMDSKGSKSTEAADLTKVSDMSVSVVTTFGKRYPMDYKLIDDNTFSIDLVGLPVGSYGLEVKCVDNVGLKRRFYAAPNEFVQIVSPTSQADIPTDGTVNSMYDMSITFSLVGAASDALTRAEASVKAADGALATADGVLAKAKELSAKADEALTLATEAKATADAQARTLTETNASMVEAEQARKESETERVTAENGRVTAEGERADAESRRQDNETTRVTAERARVTAESGRADAESSRITSEAARVTAENERAHSEQSRESAETERTIAEKARATAESQRERAFSSAKEACDTAASNATAAADKANAATASAISATEATTKAEQGRVEAEQARVEAETNRVTTEAKRASSETERQEAEDARKEAETARADEEAKRAAAESRRQDNESVRVTAEAARVTAETEREQGFTEKAAHLDELLQYIKDNHLEPDAKLAEAIKNTINGTDKFVYLDTNDGNVKSMPNTNQLGANVASVYYAGKRSIGLRESYNMFPAYNSLVRNLDLSGWDFEAATTMRGFLEGARALITLTLPDNMTLSNVTDMYCAFRACSSLQSIDTSKWTLYKVTEMQQCFRYCKSFLSLDMSKCTLENVTGMYYCFSDCSYLLELDLSSCNITRCTVWGGWILLDGKLETLRIGLIDFSLCGDVDFTCGTNIRELTGTLRGIKNNFTAKSTRMTRDSCMVVINGLETVTEAKKLTLGANNKPVSLGGKGNDPISDDDLKIATDKGWTVQFA